MYFIGFGCGAIFFAMPDQIGRKKSGIIVNIVSFVAQSLSIYCEDLFLKKFGFFLTGLMHLKTTVSFIHALELVPDMHKTFMFTMIITFDASAVGFASAVFYYY